MGLCTGGGERGVLEMYDSGRSSSGLTDALLSPDAARRVQHGRQGRFHSVARSALNMVFPLCMQRSLPSCRSCICAVNSVDLSWTVGARPVMVFVVRFCVMLLCIAYWSTLDRRCGAQIRLEV